tara:strand:+ start:1730 stop:1966 length:237 start_codon:yes stop_codon:yes gene_type:complete
MPKIKVKNEKSNLAKPFIIVKDIIPNVFIIPKTKTIPMIALNPRKIYSINLTIIIGNALLKYKTTSPNIVVTNNIHFE